MSDTDSPLPDSSLPDLDRLRAQVRADQRTTSAPLTAFGVLVLVYAVIDLTAGGLAVSGRHLTVLLFWPLATAVVLIALQWAARRRAAGTGVGEGRRPYRRAALSYPLILVLIVLLGLPLLFVGVFTPLLWPAGVLAALAAWRRDRPLGTWAAALAAVGALQGVALIVLPHDGPALWLQPVVIVAAGLALVIGGREVARREQAVA